ncbi:MAG: ATP-binding cassette domain-containing protein, partial [Lachnospiraceae bacterium]|nr:ATP-binding cassette domain-containing protein [Lachnospiraceae bacterium]
MKDVKEKKQHDNIIEAIDLSHEYVQRDEEGNVERILTAVDHVDLDVWPGQFISILGHNGSGKSTLAKHLNALLAPTGGSLYVDGKDAAKEENILPIRKTAGMVFQNPDNQLVSSVVETDVAFGMENLGVPSDKIKEKVTEVLDMVGMSDYRKARPHQLSGGQKQRIAIAGILAMKPDCIIFDEPTAMLDPNGRGEVMKTILDLNRNHGMTVLHITHYMSELVDADRIVVMDNG